MHAGGCLCGATRFQVSGPATNRCFCHCESCRRASGAPFVAWATFPASGFRTTRGELARYRSSEKVARGFCAACGTTLTYVHDARPDEIDVALVALEDSTAVRPECHIWVSNKLPWVEIADLLPQHAKWRGRAA
jgi:hypothetical protein